jgi:hypothetical protein
MLVFMSRNRRKKKSGMGTVIALGLVIVACVVVIMGLSLETRDVGGLSEKFSSFGALVKESSIGNLSDGVKAAATEKVTEKVLEKTVQQALESAGDSEAASKAKEIVKNMDKEDKETAEGIIGKYADGDTISDCLDIVGDGINSESVKEVEQYLKDAMSDQDVSALKDLYSKYVQE